MSSRRTPVQPARLATSHEIGILGLVLGGVFLFMVSMNPGRFASVDNLQGMALQISDLGLLSMAMLLSMLSGGINLSIVATANLAGIVMALSVRMLAAGDDPATSLTVSLSLVAVAAGLLAAALVGLANGLLIGYAHVSPILATLGMMTFLEGLAYVLTDGKAISGLPEPIQRVGNGYLLGVPVAFGIFLAAAAGLSLLLNRTRYGFCVYRLGANPVATAFAGIDNRRLLLQTYLCSGLLSGLAGLVMISRFNSAKADFGESYLLITILAVVLGGANPNGGYGRVLGLVLALFIFQVLSSGLNFMRVSPFLGIVLWGVIMIVVMAIHFCWPRLPRRSQSTRTNPAEAGTPSPPSP